MLWCKKYDIIEGDERKWKYVDNIIFRRRRNFGGERHKTKFVLQHFRPSLPSSSSLSLLPSLRIDRFLGPCVALAHVRARNSTMGWTCSDGEPGGAVCKGKEKRQSYIERQRVDRSSPGTLGFIYPRVSRCFCSPLVCCNVNVPPAKLCVLSPV